MKTLDTRDLVRLPTFGEALCEHRGELGLSPERLAHGSRFSADDLMHAESGLHEFSDGDLTDIAALYGVDRRGLPTGRTQLLLDLDAGELSVFEADGPIDETHADSILFTYLSVLDMQGRVDLASPISIRKLDLLVVRRALAVRREVVELHMSGSGGSPTSAPADDRSWRTAALAALAGSAIVVVVGAASLAVAGRSSSATAATAAGGAESAGAATVVVGPMPEGEIGTALVIERSSADAQLQSAGAEASVPALEIESALVNRLVTEALAQAAEESFLDTAAQVAPQVMTADVPAAAAPDTGDGPPEPPAPVVGEIGTALVIERP